MPHRILIDTDACISSGVCVANTPQLFRFDDDEVAELVPGAPVPPDGVVRDAARACPSGAIRVFDGPDEIDVG
jgi:ferredoxin